MEGSAFRASNRLAITGALLASTLAQAASEAPLTPRQRTQAIADIAAAFEQTYVFPEVGKAIASDLLARRDRALAANYGFAPPAPAVRSVAWPGMP